MLGLGTGLVFFINLLFNKKIKLKHWYRLFVLNVYIFKYIFIQCWNIIKELIIIIKTSIINNEKLSTDNY